MSNLKKLESVLNEYRNNKKFSWVFGELEHWHYINEERDPEDKVNEAELFMMEIAPMEDEVSYDERYQIRKILIDAGFYQPFNEEAWEKGFIVVSSGTPWSFIMNKMKYDSKCTYFDFLK